MERKITERDNFYWLLVALVLLLMSGSVFSQLQLRSGAMLVGLGLLLTLIVCVWSLDRREWNWRSWRLGIALATVCLVIADKVFETPAFALGELLGYFLFISLSVYLVSRQVLFTGNVDANKIVGAVCIYILLGFLWAFAYMLCEHLFPGSFSGLDSGVWQENLEQFLYYSMVTLTTLGYGDFTPVGISRAIAAIEAFTGSFTIALFVVVFVKKMTR
jgi:hypothetical protein